MEIDVLDTRTAMREILAAPPAEGPARLRAMLEPMTGMYRYFPGEVDLVDMHHMASGFRVVGAGAYDGRLRPALDALGDAWEALEHAIGEAMDVQLAATPGIAVPETLRVALVLGDPSDELFMDVSLGMTANGSVAGYIAVYVWPSPENVARLKATVVHELNHNLRYLTVPWDPATVPVGEQIVSEGLADAFARQLYGDELGYARIGVAALHDDAAFAKVLAGLGVTGMRNFSSYVHGDAIAARYGGTPVGLPTGAGYAAGNRLVDAYLAATGQTAADALLADRDDVIAATAPSDRRSRNA